MIWHKPYGVDAGTWPICTSLAYLAGENDCGQESSGDFKNRQRAGSGATPIGNRALAEPEVGKVYLQIGAVNRGMAMILAEELRSQGFDSFVAPGPNGKICRVRIGPLPVPKRTGRRWRL